MGYNLVKIPSEELVPLMVIKKDKKNIERLGHLKWLLQEGEIGKVLRHIERNSMADISGVKSNKVGAKLGTKILDNFLTGMGANGKEELISQLKTSEFIQFDFNEVYKMQIDHLFLGSQLESQFININNPAIKGIIENSNIELLLVDSIVCCRKFSVGVSGLNSKTLALRGCVENICDIESNMQLLNDRDFSISFETEKNLAFAFSCIGLSLDETGKIEDFNKKKASPLVFSNPNEIERIEIYRENILIEI